MKKLTFFLFFLCSWNSFAQDYAPTGTYVGMNFEDDRLDGQLFYCERGENENLETWCKIFRLPTPLEIAQDKIFLLYKSRSYPVGSISTRSYRASLSYQRIGGELVPVALEYAKLNIYRRLTFGFRDFDPNFDIPVPYLRREKRAVVKFYTPGGLKLLKVRSTNGIYQYD